MAKARFASAESIPNSPNLSTNESNGSTKKKRRVGRKKLKVTKKKTRIAGLYYLTKNLQSIEKELESGTKSIGIKPRKCSSLTKRINIECQLYRVDELDEFNEGHNSPPKNPPGYSKLLNKDIHRSSFKNYKIGVDESFNSKNNLKKKEFDTTNLKLSIKDLPALEFDE